jgi:hypothetical protein
VFCRVNIDGRHFSPLIVCGRGASAGRAREWVIVGCLTLTSSTSISTTTLRWVSACSTVVEHCRQEGFTECLYQRHVKPPTWRRTRDLERSNFRHKTPPASEATLTNPAVEGGTMGEKWPREFCRKWRLPRHFWVLLHAVKNDIGQAALLPLRRKAC